MSEGPQPGTQPSVGRAAIANRVLNELLATFQQAQSKAQMLSRPCRYLIVTGLSLALGGVVLRSLPFLIPIQAEAIAQDDRALVFRDRNGLPLGTLLSQNQERTLTVPLDQVAEQFQQAIVAAEDQRFWQHHGVDGLAIGRALFEAMQAEQIVSGASTISMQLARLIARSNSGAATVQSRTLVHKLQEVWQAWRLEAGMSKAEILEAYMNRLPMGGNLYGVEAAARQYFGVPAADLTLAQATLLAALPNNPVRLNPYANLPGLQNRQAYVLNQMQAKGWLDAEQKQQAQYSVPNLQLADTEDLIAPHFLFWVAAQQATVNQAEIQTTLDRTLQEFVAAQAQQVVRHLAPHNVNHAAAIVIDNQTGDVLAYVGSPDYFTAYQGRNDGVQALRQPGSALKPFLYQLALETEQFNPNSMLADTPAYYAIPNAQLYSPLDYSEQFQGPVRLRFALANSLNVPAVRVLERITVPTFLNRLLALGFRDLALPPDHYGLGLALGSGEVSLWQLAQAYSTLARYGDWLPLNITPGVTADPQTVLAKQESLIVIDMLRDPYVRSHAFGVDSALRLPFPAAIKTGTSSNFRDTWAVGFTTDYTVATWVGNFSGEPMQAVSGVTGATPLWHRIMLKLHEQQEPQAFPEPDWPKQPICADTGLAPTWSCSAVVLEYLRPEQATPATKAAATATASQSEATSTPIAAMKPQLATLKILFPQDGDRFLVDLNEQQTERQRLAFQVSRPFKPDQKQSIIWRLNGQVIDTRSPSRLLWYPQPGTWRLEVQQGELRDGITFTVEPLQEREHLKRGFSLIDD
ncbi:MAG: penicillin-binding protein 1C [Cyanobacteria bacterium P01_H01_bin.121]